MFQIQKNGITLATVDRLQFVRMQSNGVAINCAEADAQGIVVNDGFYHLPWLPAFPGCVDITLTAFDGSATIAQLDAAVIELEYQNVLLEMGVSTNAV